MSLPDDTHRHLSAQDKRALLASLWREGSPSAPTAAALSHGQRALWLLHQQAPQGAAYNTAFALRVRSAVDVAALRAALGLLVARHEVLRTRFHADDGVPMATIHARGDLDFLAIDAQGWSDAALHERAAADYRLGFDLARGPLLRTRLYTRAPDDQVLLLVLHHIVSDAWSMWLLMHELGELYPATLTGRLADLPEAAPQFADHVSWQRRMLDGPEGERLWHFWRDALAGELPVLDLPLARTRADSPALSGASHFFELDSALARRLLDLGQAQGATLFMVLLAAFQALLHRYSGQDEVIVGSPAACRNRPDSAATVGYFANPLPLRTHFRDDPSFVELLSRVRHTVLDALAHQELPFPLLVERLRPPRTPGHRPVFDVMFVLQRPPASEAFAALLGGTGPTRLGGLDVEPFVLPQMEGQFELTWEVVERREGLHCVLKFDPARYDADTVHRMEGHLRTLLAAVAQNPAQAVSTLPLLTPAEHEQVTHTWQGPPRDYPLNRCLHDWIAQQAARTPDAVAVMRADGATPLSYRALDQRANLFAHRLCQLGAGPGQVVGVLAHRGLELVVGLLAVLKAGAAYLPLDPELPPLRLARMMKDAGARLLLTHASLADELAEVGAVAAQALRLDVDEAGEPEGPASSVGPDDLAYVLYTSGSTGEPKGVENTHRGICNRLFWMQEAFALGPADRVLQKTPIGFDVSVWEFFWPLMTGATLVMAAPGVHRNGDALADTIARCGITTLHFVPSMLRPFLEVRHVARSCTSVQRVFCSGEALPLDVQQRALEVLGVPLHNLYGPTEAAVDVTHWRCRHDAALRSVPIGRPIANTRIHLLDRHGQPVPVGLPGELHIGGVQVARGYRNRPELTAQRFVPDPFAGEPSARLYRTGDLCRWLPDGNIEYLGRMDAQVKVRGQRIEPGEVEAVLCQHPQVASAVVDVDRAGDDTRLLAWFVPRRDAGAVPDSMALRTFLRGHLPEAMVPAALHSLDALPLTPNGKLDRAALPRPAAVRGDPIGAAAPDSSSDPALEQRIAAVWRSVLRVETVDPTVNFYDAGGHSLLLATLQQRLTDAFGRAPSMVEMFRVPTVRGLAAFYAGTLPAAPPHPAKAEAPQARGDIAIIGMAGRFPGAADVESFWHNLCNGVESIRFFNEQELAAAGVPPAQRADPRYVPAFGALDDIESFDAAFFGVTPREAELMDVQHRLLLECAWSALESAGRDPQAEPGRYGLYAGVGMNRYLLGHLLPQPSIAQPADASDLYRLMIGNDKDFAPTRASYKLGLTGPSVSVQTACSTSLVAVHMACRALLAGDCDAALAGGCSVTLPQDRGYLHQDGMILSPDGHCRTFDAAAGGTVGGNGVALVVLKRLEDALADGDHVHAVIKGSAINNDGAAKAGYTAPGLDGQAAVIGAALRAAGVEAGSIGYVEAHGTATPLGDPIEVAALARAFAATPAREGGTCALGSVKSNVGHLDTAAGVTGLIKAALAVEHGLVPPSLHFQTPNPALDLAATPFFVPTALRPWPTPLSTPTPQPRRAGVSSFGIGGTNAHVVLEQAPQAAPSSPSRPVQPLLLSARTPDALDAAATRLAAHLRRHPALPLADVAFTLACGRRAFEHRRVVLCTGTQEAVAALEDGARTVNGHVDPAPCTVVFMFPGQGAQRAGMAAALYRSEPVFAAQMDRCADALRRHSGLDLRGLLGSADEAPLRQTAIAQPALFAVEYALAQLWMSWGLTPQALIGHSLGEYVAACLAGVWSLEDAIGLVALRGELMQQQPTGAMLAVSLDEAHVQPWLGEGLALAAVNGPGQCVVSGPHAALAALAQRLAAQDIGCHALATSHAFHSPMMAPVAEGLRARLRGMACQAPSIPWVSNVTGQWIDAAQATDPGYWANHLLQPVRFADGLGTLLAAGPCWLVEVGPGDTLCGLARRHPGRAAARAVVPSLQAPRDARGDTAHLVEAAARLWLAGAPLDWAAFHQAPRRRRVPLPGYAFERRRHWVDAPRPDALPATLPPAAPRGLDDAFHVVSWQRTPPVSAQPGAGEHWLLLMDKLGLGTRLALRLDARGARVTRVRAGTSFARRAPGDFTVRPGDRADHERVLDALRADGVPLPSVAVHLWNVTSAAAGPVDGAARDRSYHSLVALAQALGGAHDAPPCHVVVVSNHLHDVAGDGPPDAAKALLLGPVTVIPQEYARLRSTAIDIDLAAPYRDRHAEMLLADAAAVGSSAPLAYRGGHRWAQGLVRLPLPPAMPHLRPGAAVLVVGGSGGVGIAIAESLARATPGLRLALLARGPVAPDDIARLERAGAELLCVRADLADKAGLKAALAQVRQRFGALCGVVHAAGIADGRVLALADREHAELQFAAKVDGTLHLGALLHDEPLDFFVVCGSLTSTLGGAGQAAYAAACAFQAAWAQARAAEGTWARVVAIDWDRWHETGMARGAEARFATLTGGELPEGMPAAEATQALCRVLAATAPQEARMAVSRRDVAAERARSAGFQLAPAQQPARTAARPAGAGPCMAPEGETEQLIADVWARELGITPIGVHDDFFMLGGDSLMAIRLSARLRQALAVPLDARVLYEAPSVRALAAHVVAARWVAGERSETAVPQEEGAL